MRAYSSSALRPAKKRWPWKLHLVLLTLGFAGGFASAHILQFRKPVELIISTPGPETGGAGEIVTVPEVWSDSGNISVRIPQPNAIVSSPLAVEGMERTFEQNVVLRLKDGKGNEFIKTAVIGTAPDAGIHGPYHAELTFEKPATRTGTLEVFQGSPKDGSEIDKVTVPVRFE